MSSLIPSATLIIFRQTASSPPELLMVQRAPTMRFAAGATVFPGGRVDPADYAMAQTPEDAPRIAAIRETLEETGLFLGLTRQISAAQAAECRRHLAQTGSLAPVLTAQNLTLDLDALTPFARWQQPTVGGFDTHFYLANLGTGAVEITPDNTETTHLHWSTPGQTLQTAHLVFPTRRNLERLAPFATYAAALENAAQHPPHPIMPKPEIRDGQEWLTIPPGHGYPILAEPTAKAQRG